MQCVAIGLAADYPFAVHKARMPQRAELLEFVSSYQMYFVKVSYPSLIAYAIQENITHPPNVSLVQVA